MPTVCPFCKGALSAPSKNKASKWRVCSCGGAILTVSVPSCDGSSLNCPKCKRQHRLMDKLCRKKLKCSCGFRFYVANVGVAAKAADSVMVSPAIVKEPLKVSKDQGLGPKRKASLKATAKPKRISDVLQERAKANEGHEGEGFNGTKKWCLIGGVALALVVASGYFYQTLLTSKVSEVTHDVSPLTLESPESAPKNEVAEELQEKTTNTSPASIAMAEADAKLKTDTLDEHAEVVIAVAAEAPMETVVAEAPMEIIIETPLATDSLLKAPAPGSDNEISLFKWGGDTTSKDLPFGNLRQINDGRLNFYIPRAPEENDGSNFFAEAWAPKAGLIRSGLFDHGEHDTLSFYNVNNVSQPLSYMVMWKKDSFADKTPMELQAWQAQWTSFGDPVAGRARWVILAHDNEFYCSEPMEIPELKANKNMLMESKSTALTWHTYDPETGLDKIGDTAMPISMRGILAVGVLVECESFSVGDPKKPNGIHLSQFSVMGKRAPMGEMKANPWGTGLSHPDTVASAPMCGLVALGDSSSTSVEIYNLRKKLVASLSEKDFSSLNAPHSSQSVSKTPFGMTFTQSGRLLFIGIKKDNGKKLTVYRYLIQQNKLTHFADLDISSDLDSQLVAGYFFRQKVA